MLFATALRLVKFFYKIIMTSKSIKLLILRSDESTALNNYYIK